MSLHDPLLKYREVGSDGSRSARAGRKLFPPLQARAPLARSTSVTGTDKSRLPRRLPSPQQGEKMEGTWAPVKPG